jgi:protein TonB
MKFKNLFNKNKHSLLIFLLTASVFTSCNNETKNNTSNTKSTASVDTLKIDKTPTDTLLTSVDSKMVIPNPPIDGNMPILEFDDNEVDIVPQFKGGMNELAKFLKSNMKYPSTGKANQNVVRVYVSFAVEKDGSITNPKILRNNSKSASFGKEAIRLVKLMPKWIPAKKDQKDVECSFTLPIIFRLNDN